MSLDVLITAFLDQFRRSNSPNACTVELGNYLKRIANKSLSDYFSSLGVLNVPKIRSELTEYICSLRSSLVKREALEEIFRFWAFLYSLEKIPLNPLEGMDMAVPISEESRRLKLIQSIQAAPRTIEELQQILWVSERILQSDLGVLQDGKGLFPLELEVLTKNKKIHYFCRIDPIFMSFNMTMNAIIKMSQN